VKSQLLSSKQDCNSLSKQIGDARGRAKSFEDELEKERIHKRLRETSVEKSHESHKRVKVSDSPVSNSRMPRTPRGVEGEEVSRAKELLAKELQREWQGRLDAQKNLHEREVDDFKQKLIGMRRELDVKLKEVDTLRSAQVEDSSLQRRNLETIEKEAENTIQTLTKENADLQQHLAELEDELERLEKEAEKEGGDQLDKEDVESHLEELEASWKQKLEDKEAALHAHYEGEKAMGLEMIARLEAEKAELVQAQKAYEDKRRREILEIEERELEAKELGAKQIEGEKNKQLREIERRMKTLEQELAQERSDKSAVEGQIECLESQIADSRVHRDRLSKADRELQTLNEKNEELLLKEKQALEKQRDLEAQLEAKNEELAVSEDKFAQLEHDGTDLAERYRAKCEEITRLQQDLIEADASRAKVNEVFANEQGEAEEQLIDLQKYTSEQDRKMRKLQEEREVEKTEKQQLEADLLEMEKEYTSKLDEWETEKETLEKAWEAEMKSAEERTNGLEEELNSHKKEIEIQGEAMMSVESELVALREKAGDADKLREQSEALEEEVMTIKQARDAAMTEITKRNAEICSLQQTCRTETQANEELKRELSNVDMEFSKMEKQVQNLEKELEKERAGCMEKVEVVHQREMKIAELQQQFDSLKSQEGVFREQYSQIQKDRDEAILEKNQCKDRAVLAEAEAESLKQGKTAQEAQNAHLQKQIKEAQRMAEGHNLIESELMQSRAKVGDMQREKRTLEAQVNEAHRALDAFEKREKEMEDDIQGALEANNRKEHEIADCMEKIRELEAKIDDMDSILTLIIFNILKIILESYFSYYSSVS